MDITTLTTKIIEWRTLRMQLDVLEAEIKEAVVAAGKTQKIGDVKASYSKGRKTYDYEAACKGLPPEVLKPYTEIIPPQFKVDYTALCKGEGIEAPVKSQGTPSVKLTFEVAK